MAGKWNIVTLKEYLKDLRRVEAKSVDERFCNIERNVRKALASQKELHQQSQHSSQQAIAKAEDSQKQYNQSHNDLARKMDDQYKRMLPRDEWATNASNFHDKFDEIRKSISDLRTRLDENKGKGVGVNNLFILVVALITAALAIMNYIRLNN